MKIHYIVIAVLIVSMVTTGTITYIEGLSENYGENIDFTGLENTKTAMDSQLNQSEELNDQLSTLLQPGVNAFTIPYRLLQLGWTALKTLISTPLNTLRVIIGEISTFSSETLHLPSWIQSVIISMLTVTIIAILIYGFYKWKFED